MVKANTFDAVLRKRNDLLLPQVAVEGGAAGVLQCILGSPAGGLQQATG